MCVEFDNILFALVVLVEMWLLQVQCRLRARNLFDHIGVEQLAQDAANLTRMNRDRIVDGAQSVNQVVYLGAVQRDHIALSVVDHVDLAPQSTALFESNEEYEHQKDDANENDQ